MLESKGRCLKSPKMPSQIFSKITRSSTYWTRLQDTYSNILRVNDGIWNIRNMLSTNLITFDLVRPNRVEFGIAAFVTCAAPWFS